MGKTVVPDEPAPMVHPQTAIGLVDDVNGISQIRPRAFTGGGRRVDRLSELRLGIRRLNAPSLQDNTFDRLRAATANAVRPD